jgi:pyruvate/2-oxoglutarate dehydrogenase complex dihydrolipoamide dehydrogenase (E3) component
VIEAPGQFINEDTVEAGGWALKARRFAIATGSRPLVPPIPGLDQVPYLTNETVFDLTEQPRHLIVLGGGPIGCELAQAFRRLGSAVTLVERARLLPREDPEFARLIQTHLTREGVQILDGQAASAVAQDDQGISVTIGDQIIRGSHLLVAIGRAPIVEGLGLNEAGIAYGPQGIKVDAGLKTTNKRVYALGDVIGGLAFTHVAGYQAGLVLRNALFRLPIRYDALAIPRATYVDPELASVGLDEVAARSQGAIRVLRWPLAENDRAVATRQMDGLIKVITDDKGRVLGATILAPHAGDLIQIWAQAVAARTKIGAIAQAVVAYPTLGEISKRAAGSYFTPFLFSRRTQALVKFLQRLPF